jgi:hypothetical protein
LTEEEKTWSFIVGEDFGVTTAGQLYGNGANIKGHIESESGAIGSWTIREGYITDSLASTFLIGADDSNLPGNLAVLVPNKGYIRMGVSAPQIYTG